jgi:sulfur-oxidizing protein SoxY
MSDYGRISRRAALTTLGALALEAALARTPASAQTAAAARAGAAAPPLGGQEKVDDALRRVFGGRPIRDGGALIKLDVPLIAENGSVVPVSVEAQSPMTPESHVRRIYVVADRNRIPIVARAELTPEAGRAFMGANIRLGETTDVRAIVEQSDGTLLQARREVKVTVGGCGG